MYKRFKHTLKYIFLIGILCFCMTACGNADGQSAAEQSGTEIIQEPSEEIPILEPESTPEPEPMPKPEPESTPKSEPAQRQWQVYIQPDMPEPFVEVLKQYEDFMNADVQSVYDDDVCSKLNVTYDEWYLCYELCESLKSILELYAEDATAELEIYSYSLTDLTGDGFPELIMGRDSDFGTDNDYLYVVFYYSETEGIKMMDTTRYFDMSLYEGGIIEYISAGMSYTMTYLQYQEETENWERAACIIVDWDYQSETKLYYHGVNLADFSDPDNEPMSEEEYRDIVERYTAEPVELEWIPMFCGEASEDEAESKTNESVTVIAKVTHYFADESYIYWTEYEYDSVGNEIKETSYSHDGSIDYWYESEYDNAGNRVKYICHGADGDISYWEEYEYDGAGNKMKSISYYADKGINGRDEYAYDSAGNRVKWIHYNADDSIFDTEEYEYDSIGNLTKTIGYNGHRDITRRIEYEYDNVGNLLGWIQYNGYDNDYDIRAKYEYDNAGKQTEFTSYDTDGNVVDRYEYKYDSKGNLTEEINCGNNGSTYFRTEYEYDSAGNLTKMTEYYLSHRIEYEYITITPQ